MKIILTLLELVIVLLALAGLIGAINLDVYHKNGGFASMIDLCKSEVKFSVKAYLVYVYVVSVIFNGFMMITGIDDYELRVDVLNHMLDIAAEVLGIPWENHG